MINYLKSKREKKQKLEILKTSSLPLFPHMILLEKRNLFEKFICSFMFRGYLYGWFNTALECSKLDFSDEETFIEMMVSCHHAILSDYGVDSWSYLDNSVANMTNRAFIKSSKDGHNDFIQLINPKSEGGFIRLLEIYKEVEILYSTEE